MAKDLAYFQELAKQSGTSIQHLMQAGELLHVRVSSEQVPDDLTLAFVEWMTKNLVLDVTSFVASKDGSFMALNEVSQGLIVSG